MDIKYVKKKIRLRADQERVLTCILYHINKYLNGVERKAKLFDLFKFAIILESLIFSPINIPRSILLENLFFIFTVR